MRLRYPKINPLRDLETKEVADVVDTLRDQGRVTYDDDGSVKYGERRVIKKVTFDHVNEKKVEIEEGLRFSDFANVRMSSSQKGGRKTYVPRITVASPTSFTIAIDGNDEEVSFILEFKGV